MKRSIWLALVGIIVSTGALAADPAYYVRRGTWQETMRASREALVEHLARQAGKPVVSTKPELGQWYGLGTFSGGDSFGKDHGPEKEVDLNKTYGKAKWRRIEADDGKVHGLRLGGNTSTYFYRTIRVGAPATIMSWYGSDDGLAVWLNGKNVLSNKVNRGPGPNQDKAKLVLKAGENHCCGRGTCDGRDARRTMP